jgi:hypothetical protein
MDQCPLRFIVSGCYETNEKEHTAHVNHGDLELLPGPTVGPAINPGDDGFHFVEARKCIQSIMSRALN